MNTNQTLNKGIYMDEIKLKELNKLNRQIEGIKKEKNKLANFISIVNEYRKKIDNGDSSLSINLIFYGEQRIKSCMDTGNIESAKELEKKIFHHIFFCIENILWELKKEETDLETKFKKG
jgi:hypothetical protein